MDIYHIWYLQDDENMDRVRQIFPDHVISRNGDVPWPPRSPDLNLCNFFLSGYLKAKVYVSKPRTLTELKDAIRREIARIPNEMLENVIRA